jgi:hypothetical protein
MTLSSWITTLRILFATHPQLLAAVPRIVDRSISNFLLKRTERKTNGTG